MQRTALKLFLFLGLSVIWLAGKAYVDDTLYLRRDWLLLPVIEDRVQHRAEAGYFILFGAGITLSGLAGLAFRRQHG